MAFVDNRARRALENPGRSIAFSQNRIVRDEASVGQLVEQLFAGEEALRLADELRKNERLPRDGSDVLGQCVA